MSSFSIICAGWMFHIMWPLSIISTSIALTRRYNTHITDSHITDIHITYNHVTDTLCSHPYHLVILPLIRILTSFSLTALSPSPSYAILYQINAYVIMDPAVADIIIICYVLFALTNYIGQFYLEITLRNEFQSFRKTTFSHLFLELSLDAVQKNLRKPLQSILLAKHRFLRMVENVAVTQRIGFTPSLLGEFDTLNIGNHILPLSFHSVFPCLFISLPFSFPHSTR